MRIVETFDVIFRGDLSGYTLPQNRIVYIKPDEGEMFEVQIPKIQHLYETFAYMSDNDCLRHLKSLEPIFTTNLDEIEMIQRQNAAIEENIYLSGASFSNGIKYASPPSANYKSPSHYFNLVPVPKPVYECKWTFWSREHAVMTKLAQGGNI